MLDQGVNLEMNKEENTDTMDGMDVAICAINRNESRLDFAGAYRPLLYMDNGDLMEVKGTKKSIGDPKKENHFVTTSIKLDGSTVVYLFSDGLVDQNNGTGEKFGLQNLREFIKKKATLPISKQKELLNKIIDDFMGDEIQRDDITVAIFKPTD